MPAVPGRDRDSGKPGAAREPKPRSDRDVPIFGYACRMRAVDRPVEESGSDDRGLRSARFRVGSHELAVLSFPVGVPELPATLSLAERAVAWAVMEGFSNAEIAEIRRTSERTVANQVASVLKKLRVRSRGELVVALEGRTK